MLYKPAFCCQCGEKIERNRWLPWTSGRFCKNCESDYRKAEWLPTSILALIALISSLFAFGSYLKTPEKPLALTPSRMAVNSVDNSQSKENAVVNYSKTTQSVSANVNQMAAKNVPSLKNTVSAEDLQNESDEPTYFCGAQTKKGTPCSRKVKGGGRCWQHTGQPSMLPKDKLLAGR